MKILRLENTLRNLTMRKMYSVLMGSGDKFAEAGGRAWSIDETACSL